MFFVVILLKPILYIGALALGRQWLRGYARQWTTAMELLVLGLIGGLRFGLGIGTFLATAIWVNAQFGADSTSPVLHWPAATVLGPMGLALWVLAALVAFPRAPWSKRIAFALAAELLSLVLELFNGMGDGLVYVVRLSDLVLSGRGLGGC